MRGTGVWFLEGVGTLGLPYVPKTKELGMPGHKPGGGQGNVLKIMFINYVRKPVF
jgi:hypothetical protein